MPFHRRSFAEIAAAVKTDIQGALEGTAAFFRRSFERGMQMAITGVSHHLHGHMDWIARQMDPRTCDEDSLEIIHGEPFGVYRKPPREAKLTLTVQGINGTVITALTVFVRADGARYLVDADATIASGAVALAITAELAGAAGNCADGTPLNADPPIAGVSAATVTATTRDGTDLEDVEDYRQRVIDRKQNPITGGGPGDYRQWVLEVPGVTRAWEYPRVEGAGTVTVYAVNDAADPITLTPAKIFEIEEYLDQPGRKPSLADVFVRTPTLSPLDPVIDLSPYTPEVTAAVNNQLTGLLTLTAHPGGMTVLVSKLDEAISTAPGEDDHDLISPSANVDIPFGSLAVLGTATYGPL